MFLTAFGVQAFAGVYTSAGDEDEQTYRNLHDSDLVIFYSLSGSKWCMMYRPEAEGDRYERGQRYESYRASLMTQSALPTEAVWQCSVGANRRITVKELHGADEVKERTQVYEEKALLVVKDQIDNWDGFSLSERDVSHSTRKPRSSWYGGYYVPADDHNGWPHFVSGSDALDRLEVMLPWSSEGFGMQIDNQGVVVCLDTKLKESHTQPRAKSSRSRSRSRSSSPAPRASERERERRVASPVLNRELLDEALREKDAGKPRAAMELFESATDGINLELKPALKQNMIDIEAACLKSPPGPGVLQVSEIMCNKLAPAEAPNRSDPYIKYTLKTGDKEAVTKHLSDELSPVFTDEVLDLDVVDEDTTTWRLLIEVFDHGPRADHDFLGSLEIDLSAEFKSDWRSPAGINSKFIRNLHHNSTSIGRF